MTYASGRSRSKSIRYLAFMVGILIFVLLCSAASATVSYEQSGHVTKPGGAAVSNFRLSLYVSGQYVSTSATDASGRFEFFVEDGLSFAIAAASQEAGLWYSVSPEVRTGTSAIGYIHHDFTVRPWPKVRGTVTDANYDGFVKSGVEVVVDGEVVDITDSNGAYEFTVGQNVIGLPSPELFGTLLFRKSLHSFSPATMAYNAGDGNDENMSSVDMYRDNLTSLGVAAVSWDYESGAGWGHFPLCPAHDITNNPNIYVDLYFSPGYLSTLVPADHLRLSATPSGIIPAGGVSAASPVGATYGRHVTFSSPITNCGLADLKLEVAVDQAAGGVAWYPVDSAASGASTLDTTGDGLVNLSELPAFSAANGSHLGDLNYNACVDYNSDEYVNLNDVSMLSAHMGHSDAKSSSQWTQIGELSGILDVTVTESRDGIELALALNRERRWQQVTIALPGDGWDLDDLSWKQPAGFRGEGIIATDTDGKAALYLFSDASRASSDLGMIAILGNQIVPKAVSATSVTLTNMVVSIDAELTDDELEGGEKLGTEMRLWSSRTVGSATGEPVQLHFNLPQSMSVSLSVFDIRGHRVAKLLSSESMQQGQHAISWDARDSSGIPVSSGVYFARLESGGKAANQRLLVVR